MKKNMLTEEIDKGIFESKKAIIQNIIRFQKAVDNPVKTTTSQNHVEIYQWWKTKRDWQTISEVVSDEIKETIEREGFVSKTLQETKTKTPQFRRYPEQYDFFKASIKITEKELAKTPWDVIDRKYHTGLVQIFKPEERAWYNEVKKTPNKLTFKKFTVVAIEEMLVELRKLNIPLSCLCISFDVYQDLVKDIQFESVFDPYVQHLLLLEGYFGKILGVDVYTDGFRPRKLRTLPPGTAVAFGEAKYVGGYTREPQKVETIVDSQKKTKTWEIGLAEIMFVSNPKAICIATRK